MSDEQARIARAYRGYEESKAASGRWSLDNPGNRKALAERLAATSRLLAARGLLPFGPRRALEVGCGTGAELARFVALADIDPGQATGVDLLPERVEVGRRQHPDLDLRAMNAEKLEFADASYDLVLAITLFSSIREPWMASRVAAEIERVIKPGGALFWYDVRYDNPRNAEVHGVSAADVRSLFPRLRGSVEKITLLPPLSRRLGPLTPVLYPALATLPGLRTHLIGVLEKAPA